MEKLKKIIIIIGLLIIILTVIVVIIISRKGEESNQNLDKSEEYYKEEEYDTSKIREVTEKSKFYTVEYCVSEYLRLMNNNTFKFYGRDDTEESLKVEEESTINQTRYNILSQKYINDNKIAVENINQYIDTIEEDLTFIPTDIKVIIGEQVENYIVCGFLTDARNKYIEDIYMKVNLDTINNAFSVEPLKDTYDSIEKIDFKYDGTRIEKNDDNVYKEIYLTNEEISKKYFRNLKSMILNKPELLYNHFDEEYRDKRFGSYDNFKKYIDNNAKELSIIYINKYLIDYKVDSIEYVCKDQYENFYVFEVVSPTNYTVKLDTYTIQTEKFKTEYESASKEKKVKMNIDKFILMINSQNYTAAYNLLYPEFRQRYFDTEEKFIEYINGYMYKRNKIEFQSFETHENTYMCEVLLTDLDPIPEEEALTWNFAVQLNDETDFVISFEIKE